MNQSKKPAVRSYKRRPRHVLEAAQQEVAAKFSEAKAAHEAGDASLAQRRVKQARRAAMKVQLSLPSYWNRYCRNCNAYLVQGENSTVRIKHGTRILRCGVCGYLRRKVMARPKTAHTVKKS